MWCVRGKFTFYPGARGQKTHIDYPYYNIAKPGEKVSFLKCI